MRRVLLVDDHVAVRQGLKKLLLDASARTSIADAASGEEALRMALSAKWDLVILDISLPGKSGLATLEELRRSRPQLPVLVLSMHREEQFALRALREGAAGYVTKHTAAADLVVAITQVLAGKKYVSPTLAERLAGEIGRAPEARS
jgi:two-component system invasion response regulator UvrY